LGFLKKCFIRLITKFSVPDVGRFGSKWLHYGYHLFVLAVYLVFKNFCHLVCFFICGHSTYCPSAFVVYVHTPRNRYEFYLLPLRFSFLNIPYCFSVSNLAESKLFLLPKLSNVPPKCLLFVPLVLR
jgi:hypothetical protein